MKRIIKVSLGGMAFTLQDDAYQKFEMYINTLKEKLGANKDTDEIVRDIEERASELFSELLAGKTDITIDMVESVIETLGNPEEIADTDEGHTTSSQQTEEKPNRSLYRDGERAIIAGVCSGLGTYFNVDLVVFRIIFGLLLFVNGLGLLLYIVLWIAVPRATTAKQRLEMKGEPINMSNIEKDLKREYDEVRKNLNKKEVTQTIDKGISVFSKILIPILKFLGVIIKIIGILIAIVLIVTGTLALIAIIGSIFFGGVALSSIDPTFTEFSLNELLVSAFDLGSTAWVTIPLFLIIAIPLLSLVFLGIRIIFNFRLRSAIISSLAAVIWVMAIVTLAVTAFLQARSFTIRESISEIYTLSVPENTSKLYIESSSTADSTWVKPYESITLDEYKIGLLEDGFAIFGKPKVSFGTSMGNEFEIVVEKKSRGGTKSGAIQNARNVQYGFILQDSILKFSPHFKLPKGQQWRVQEVNITINLPRNKRVYVSDSMLDILNHEQELCHCWPDELIDKTWILRNERMVEY